MKDHSQKGFKVENRVSDSLENTYLPAENTGNFTEKQKVGPALLNITGHKTGYITWPGINTEPELARTAASLL